MLKQIKWSSLLFAIGYIAAGALLIIYPTPSSDLIAYVVGIAAIVFGIVNLTTYFLLELRASLFRNEFIIGVMAILFGLVILIKQNMLRDLIPVVLGLVIVTSGCQKLQNSVVAKRIRYDQATVYMILSAIAIFFGLLVMFYLAGRLGNKDLYFWIGIGLLYCGLSDLFVTVVLANKFNKYLKEFEKGMHPIPVEPAPESDIPAEPQPAHNDPGIPEPVISEPAVSEPVISEPAVEEKPVIEPEIIEPLDAEEKKDE